MNGIPLFEQSDARDALKKRCREAKIPIRLLEDLVEAVREQIGKERARGLSERFDQLLDPPVGDDDSDGQED
jgi:hypothetical protein